MKKLNDETRAGILGGIVAGWTLVCLTVSGALGLVMWIAGLTVATMYAIHDERLDRERQRRHRYEDYCARMAQEEEALCSDTPQ